MDFKKKTTISETDSGANGSERSSPYLTIDAAAPRMDTFDSQISTRSMRSARRRRSPHRSRRPTSLLEHINQQQSTVTLDEYQQFLRANLLNVFNPNRDITPKENGRVPSVLYAIFMAPASLDRYSWFILISTAIMSIPMTWLLPNRDMLFDSVYFGICLTALTCIIQETYSQAESKFCKICQGTLSKWRKYGAFACMIFALLGCMSESSLYLVADAWYKQNCKSVFNRMPFSMRCEIHYPTEPYQDQFIILKICSAVLFWIGVIWTTEIPFTFAGDYRAARRDNLYTELGPENCVEDGHGASCHGCMC